MKKRVIYLHIGIEKTGTSTLQSVGAGNRVALAKAGLLYPRAPGELNHYALPAYAGNLASTRGLLALPAEARTAAGREKYRESFAAELRRELAESPAPSVWLSNEHLSSRIREREEIKRLADLLQSLASEVQVIVYLRHQPELFISSHSTRVKAGGSNQLRPPSNPSDPYYNFETMLAAWADVFGDKALKLRIFDRSLLVGGDVVSDFFAAIGFTPPKKLAVPPARNPRLDGASLEFLTWFHEFVPIRANGGPNPDYGDVVRVIEAMAGGPALAVPPETLRTIEAMFAPSNAAVARRYLGSEARLFPARSYAESGPGSHLTIGRAVEIAAQLWRQGQAWKRKALAATPEATPPAPHEPAKVQ